MIRPFNEFWFEVIKELQKPRLIGIWTPKDGYSRGGKFKAVAGSVVLKYREQFPPFAAQAYANDQWIICTRIEGKTTANIFLGEAALKYDRWADYRTNGISRDYFGNANSYLISLFREFDHLIGFRKKLV